MTTTIALSIDRILEAVNAEAALHHYLSPEKFPHVLGRANSPALRTLARRCAAHIVFDLIPFTTGTNILDSDAPDVITIDFGIPAESPGLRESLESVLVEFLLAAAWSGHDAPLSELHHRSAQKMIKTIRHRLSGRPGRIEPAA